MHETSVNTGCLVLLSPWVKSPFWKLPKEQPPPYYSWDFTGGSDGK